MRPIKFRGKCTSDSQYDGEWVYGGYVLCEKSKDALIISAYTDICTFIRHVISKTVGQFTGLHDADGNDIYEGDILQSLPKEEYLRQMEKDGMVSMEYMPEQLNWNYDTKVIVTYKDFLFDLIEVSEQPRTFFLNHPDYWRVIGNIHDNPELVMK